MFEISYWCISFKMLPTQNIFCFIDEFTRLVTCFTKDINSRIEDTKTVKEFLSNEEIAFAVYSVFRAFEIEMKKDEKMYETNEIENKNVEDFEVVSSTFNMLAKENVFCFINEFTKLVACYTKGKNSRIEGTRTIEEFLSDEQIAFAVYTVLYVLGIKMKKDENMYETDEIDIENVEDFEIIHFEEVSLNKEIDLSEDSNFSEVNLPKRSDEKKSDESQPAVINFDSSLSGTTFKAVESKTKISLNVLQSEKQIISQNSATCVNVGKSNTSIYKEDKDGNIKENIVKASLNENSSHSTLKDAQECMIDATKKTDNEENQMSQLTKQLQKSGSFYLDHKTRCIFKTDSQKPKIFQKPRRMKTFSRSSSFFTQRKKLTSVEYETIDEVANIVTFIIIMIIFLFIFFLL